MIKNYFKIALRNIFRNKVFSFINIAGLAAGLAVSFCIIIYIIHELSYDKQNINYDRIYRVDSDWSENHWRLPFTCLPLAETAKKTIPGISSYTRVKWANVNILNKSNQIEFKNKYFADPSLFNVFTFHFIQGNPKYALSNPQSVVLSKEAALKCFGKTDVLGKFLTIKMDSISIPVKITGLLKKDNLPSTIIPDVILPLKLLFKLSNFYKPDEWIQIQAVNTYFIINHNADFKLITSSLKKLYQNGVGEKVSKIQDISFHIVPLSKTYFVNNEFPVPSYFPVIKTDNIIIYSAIAFLVLLLACINFIILTIAKSTTRNIEIGVRKVIGAGRKDITLLLIVESTLTSLIAFPLSLLIIELIFPYFEGIINRNIHPAFYENVSFLSGFLLVSIFVGFLSGLYTVFSFSRINPAEIIRRKSGMENKKVNLKRVLISFQMIVFITLIISSIVLKSQLQLTHTKDMGFNVKNFITINCNGINGKAKVFKNMLNSCPGIVDMAYSLHVFPYARGNRWGVSRVDDPGQMKSFGVPLIGYDYPRLVKMHLIAGKFPTAENYKGKTIINETAAEELGFKSPVGKTILMLKQVKKKIIGVVKDFNLNSLHDKIRPVAMLLGDYNLYLVIKYSPEKISSTIPFIKDAWSKISSKPIDITFLDKKIDNMYKSDLRFNKAIDFFTILAIIIAAMGLFGAVLFSTQQRIKEIGIRKILGASVFEIVNLILKEILTLLFISAIIAAPVAYYFMHNWLQDFAYRIQLGWWIYALSFGIALLITLTAALFQVIKAATVNPVESLRNE